MTDSHSSIQKESRQQIIYKDVFCKSHIIFVDYKLKLRKIIKNKYKINNQVIINHANNPLIIRFYLNVQKQNLMYRTLFLLFDSPAQLDPGPDCTVDSFVRSLFLLLVLLWRKLLLIRYGGIRGGTCDRVSCLL